MLPPPSPASRRRHRRRRRRLAPLACAQDLTGEFYESRYCVVADYGVFANSTVAVRNRERAGSVTGAETDILGWAAINRTTLNTASGALQVNLNGVPFPAPYDIILLGPASYGPLGAYQYAVVSDQLEFSLFVLARDPADFNRRYNATVFTELEALGFDTILNTPIQTFQDGCPTYIETDLSAWRRWAPRRAAPPLLHCAQARLRPATTALPPHPPPLPPPSLPAARRQLQQRNWPVTMHARSPRRGNTFSSSSHPPPF